jgi:adenine-specific DNA methylase
MEDVDTTGKIVFVVVAFANMLLFVAMYLLIRKHIRDKKKNDRIKKEIALENMRILMFKHQFKTILEFLPHPDEKNPFENNDQEKN